MDALLGILAAVEMGTDKVMRYFKWPFIATLAYEIFAYGTGNKIVPTISKLCGRYRLLGPVVIGGLVFHLYANKIPKGRKLWISPHSSAR